MGTLSKTLSEVPYTKCKVRYTWHTCITARIGFDYRIAGTIEVHIKIRYHVIRLSINRVQCNIANT